MTISLHQEMSSGSESESIGASPWVSHCHTPVFGATIDDSSQSVRLILEDILGMEGDVAEGCDIRQAEDVLDVIAEMYAKWWDDHSLADIPWLPRWGQGQADLPYPYRERAGRFCQRAKVCRERFCDRISPRLMKIIAYLESEYETLHQHVATLVPTLIHPTSILII